MPAPRVIVVGSANVDFCMRLPVLPAPGETLSGGIFSQAFGGKGANAAVAAAQAGGEAALIGCVGREPLGDQMLAQLQGKRVSTGLMERSAIAATGTAFIFLDARGHNMIGVAAGANDEVTPGRMDHLRPQLKQADVILVQNEVPAGTVSRLLEIAAEDQLHVLYNSAPARAIAPELMAAVEWLVVNESEATSLSGCKVQSPEDAAVAAAELLRLGARQVFITLGASGVCAADAKSRLHVPAFAVSPIDTVAAGDIFCGTLAVALAEGQARAEAIRFASSSAAISVTRAGAQDSAPSRREIEAFLAEGV